MINKKEKKLYVFQLDDEIQKRIEKELKVALEEEGLYSDEKI